MKVAICCRGVPVDPVIDSVAIAGGDIRYTDTEYYINEADAYALQAAVNLKSSHKAETVALTVGPLRALEVLYYALAKGIEQVLRIDGETTLPELIAGGLAPTLKQLAPQLVLVGVQSEDWMGGEVGIYLSRALDASLAFAVMEICELTETHVRVKREIGAGRKAEVKLALPAVLCIQTGMTTLPYLSAIKRQKVRSIPIRSAGGVDREGVRTALAGMMAYEIKDVALPSREGQAEMITGERSERARKVLQIIGSAV